MDFIGLKDYAVIEYEVTCDGEVTAKGILKDGEMPEIKPHGIGSLNLDFEVPQKGKCYLKVQYLLKQNTALLKAGSLLGFEEILLE
ncbi:DUF4981 domain-containing protein, partial [Collinsella aerofaciens]|nr:DUF4981 domain-containing protein [Collinsella aerofaciens]